MDVKCYLKLRVDAERTTPINGKWKVNQIYIDGATRNPPTTSGDGSQRVIELTLKIPDDWLLPLQMDAMPDQQRLQEDFQALMTEVKPK